MAISEVQAGASAPVPVIKKAQDQAKLEGEQAVQLIQTASQVAQSAAPSDPNVGTRISTVA